MILCTVSTWSGFTDSPLGIRGEISLSIRVDVFFDASRYRQSSLGVQFFHSCGVPNGYIVDLFIGFIQELVMTDDPEHQWIEKIRTSRASNEARQHLFSRLSGELQRKLGLKVLNLGGNAVIGYQLHFDLEGETGVVVRGIGTAVRLRKQTAPRSPPSSPVGAPPRLPGSIELNTESPVGSADTPSALEREAPFKGSAGNLSQTMELGEFPFLTISQMPPGMIRHFGSIVASKSVKLMDKNTP
ncbi:C2 domain-containing protein 5, partial [Clonorchis sinensis]